MGRFSILEERIYFKDEPKASDHDDWLECRRCGELIPKYQEKTESELGEILETIVNPFETDSILGLDNKREEISLR